MRSNFCKQSDSDGLNSFIPVLALLLTLLLLLQIEIVNSDEYVDKTGQSRKELLESGEYLPASIFGETKSEHKESHTLEFYNPEAGRQTGEGATFQGLPKWPKTFQQNLKRVPKQATFVLFKLYTLRSPPDGEFISDQNLATIRSSTWNTSADVKILVHGYKQRASNPKMPQAQKDAYLLMESGANIVVVDWEYLANERNYFESAMYSQKVGRRLGKFILTLKDAGLAPSYMNFHIIGYCLGAHVAGVAGQIVKDQSGGRAQIWRITGLDPSGPGFHRARNEIRLDATDAQFVDVIHTNAGEIFRSGVLGVAGSVGHADFFPNGGVEQPVCGDNFVVGNLISKCSHKKSADYFTRSIKGEKFKSCVCANWGVFVNGECKCLMGPFMGEYLAPMSRGTHYLRVFEYSLFEILEQMGALGSD